MSKKPRPPQQFWLHNPLGRFMTNTYRVLTLPLGQFVMAIGVFPGQMVSGLMRMVNKLPFISRPMAKALGVGRPAHQIWGQDYLKSNEIFPNKAKAHPQDTRHLILNRSEALYENSFGVQAKLDAYSFEHENFDRLPAEEKYYRLHASGNSGNCGRFFSELAHLCRLRPELKCITYNHPGVEGRGITLSQDDLINALCTQVKTLINQGIKPENIELTGFSIGAATAAEAAKQLLKEGIEVNLYCAQTFGSLSSVIMHNLPIIGPAFRFLKAIPIIGWLASGAEKLCEWLIIKPLLLLTNWDMKPARAFAKINPDRKALTFVKPETQGKGFWKKILKLMGRYTGFFKQKHIDKVIPAHVSLPSRVNIQGKLKTKYNSALQNLYHPQLRAINLDLAYQASDNAISRNALKRLQRDPAHSTQLINLAILGYKGRRMAGAPKKDAHSTLAYDLPIREIKNRKWMAPHQPNFKALAQSALEVSGGEHKPEGHLSALTYYTLFHDAIKNHNRMLRQESMPLEHKEEIPAAREVKAAV